MATPRISTVVTSRNEGNELRLTVENLRDTLPDRSEIVVIDDGSTDGSTRWLQCARQKGVRLFKLKGQGVAKARILGSQKAKGDVVVFADAHIRGAAQWWRPLCELLEDPKVGAAAPGIQDYNASNPPGYGLTFKNSSMEVRWHRRAKGPKEALILPGACFATRRDVLDHTGGWDAGLLHRGNVDNECCVRLWLFGYRLMVSPETLVQHQFRRRSPYPVGWPEYLFNRLRLAFVHLNSQRLGKVVARLRNYPHFGEALALVADSDVKERRAQMRSQRAHDDDWLFERFRLRW